MAIKSNILRDQICALLRGSKTSVAENLDALSQCAAQIRNRGLVGNIARECGLTLVGFLANDTLELYYDLKRGRHNLGFISKGWEDPGFRIGDLVEIGGWDRDVVKAASRQIMRVCATQGIGLTIQEAPTTIALQLDGVLYSEGFNRDTFLKTLESLNVCVENIHSLIPEERPGRNPSAGILCGSLADLSSRSH
jgi:hypothetical protein